jgi:hypothetical protein
VPPAGEVTKVFTESDGTASAVSLEAERNMQQLVVEEPGGVSTCSQGMGSVRQCQWIVAQYQLCHLRLMAAMKMSKEEVMETMNMSKGELVEAMKMIKEKMMETMKMNKEELMEAKRWAKEDERGREDEQMGLMRARKMNKKELMEAIKSKGELMGAKKMSRDELMGARKLMSMWWTVESQQLTRDQS